MRSSAERKVAVEVAPPWTGADAHEAEAGWQQTTICQVVDSRHQLLAGKIASHTEDH